MTDSEKIEYLRSALRDLRAQVWAHVKMDVRKHYGLMVAEAVAGAALRKTDPNNPKEGTTI